MALSTTDQPAGDDDDDEGLDGDDRGGTSSARRRSWWKREGCWMGLVTDRTVAEAQLKRAAQGAAGEGNCARFVLRGGSRGVAATVLTRTEAVVHLRLDTNADKTALQLNMSGVANLRQCADIEGLCAELSRVGYRDATPLRVFNGTAVGDVNGSRANNDESSAPDARPTYLSKLGSSHLPFYRGWGECSRLDAELELRDTPERSFVVRRRRLSNARTGSLAISYKSSAGEIKHMAIHDRFDEGLMREFFAVGGGQTSQEFPSLWELVESLSGPTKLLRAWSGDKELDRRILHSITQRRENVMAVNRHNHHGIQKRNGRGWCAFDQDYSSRWLPRIFFFKQEDFQLECKSTVGDGCASSDADKLPKNERLLWLMDARPVLHRSEIGSKARQGRSVWEDCEVVSPSWLDQENVRFLEIFVAFGTLEEIQEGPVPFNRVPSEMEDGDPHKLKLAERVPVLHNGFQHHDWAEEDPKIFPRVIRADDDSRFCCIRLPDSVPIALMDFVFEARSVPVYTYTDDMEQDAVLEVQVTPIAAGSCTKSASKR